jgi:hypothetical protein
VDTNSGSERDPLREALRLRRALRMQVNDVILAQLESFVRRLAIIAAWVFGPRRFTKHKELPALLLTSRDPVAFSWISEEDAVQ